jgi:large repetitive protein
MSSNVNVATITNVGSVSGINDGLSTITYTNSLGCKANVEVTVHAIPAAPILSADVSYCSFLPAQSITATGTGAGVINWYADASLTTNIGTGTSYTPVNQLGNNEYFVTETVNGCESSSSAAVHTITSCDIEIPTAFTPNGDEVNDTWELKYIDTRFPNNQVRIYNRWGNLLFESEKGKYEVSPWDGTFKDEVLPVSSYYFIIQLSDENVEDKTGTVTIIRK